jgi:mono/diheme cytochrome c family protein
MSLRNLGLVTVLMAGGALAGCNRMDMADGARLRPYEPSAFFSDKRSAQDPVPGTVARGDLAVSDVLRTGRENGELVSTFPFPVTRAVLERGQDRFNIHCAVCHDRAGTGRGMIVRRGFRQPPSYHEPRLREAPVGHFVDVITNGFGAMYAQADRIAPEDRWAIAAYIRALQRSQNATLADVPLSERKRLLQSEVAP